MKVLIMGSSGSIRSEMVGYFDQRAQSVVGSDNNMLADFFGPRGDTRWNLCRLTKTTRNFRGHDVDVRDRQAMRRVFQRRRPV
jgi:CDP-paratose 2-epimerase